MVFDYCLHIFCGVWWFRRCLMSSGDFEWFCLVFGNRNSWCFGDFCGVGALKVIPCGGPWWNSCCFPAYPPARNRQWTQWTRPYSSLAILQFTESTLKLTPCNWQPRGWRPAVPCCAQASITKAWARAPPQKLGSIFRNCNSTSWPSWPMKLSLGAKPAPVHQAPKSRWE